MASAVDLLVAAGQAQGQGRLAEARTLAQRAAAADPTSAQPHVLLGMIAAHSSEPESAVSAFKRALQLDSSQFDAALWLSVVLRRMRRLPEAVEAAERAVALSGQDAHAQNQLGMCLLDVGRPDSALECFERATRIDPRGAESFDNLGRALEALNRHPEAIKAYRRALELGPPRPGTLFRLGEAYMTVPDPEASAECARTLLRLNPDSAQAEYLLAGALVGSDKLEEAVTHAEHAIQLAPGNAVPVGFYGKVLQSLGRIEEAEEQFKRSIELEPRQGFSYNSLTQNRKMAETDRPLVDQMVALSLDKAMPAREVLQIELALGKALEDLGDYGEAMAHMDAAKRIDHELKPSVAPFSLDEFRGVEEYLERAFTPEFLARHRGIGSGSELPIFVVGFMRSGTTLAEQILSSHPAIGGAGEQFFWPDATDGSSRGFFRSDDPSSLDQARLKRTGKEYLALLDSLVPGKARVVDKMNMNYLVLGVIHLAFPNARIIHMVRDPVDTCISTWAAPVSDRIDYGGSKQSLVWLYQHYQKVVDIWRRILPPDRFLDVRYEELVANQEALSRQMVAFCGVEWDAACLRPEQNKRAVRTPSAVQVRQPVYKTSVERWRRFEPWLGEFRQLLGDVSSSREETKRR